MALDFTSLNTAITNLNKAVLDVKAKVIILEDGQVTEQDQAQINTIAASVTAAVTTLNGLIEASLETE